jgi:hypothetical protein
MEMEMVDDVHNGTISNYYLPPSIRSAAISIFRRPFSRKRSWYCTMKLNRKYGMHRARHVRDTRTNCYLHSRLNSTYCVYIHSIV